MTDQEIEARVQSARNHALKPRLGTLWAETPKARDEQWEANQDRAEKYCRWRIEQVEAGTVSSL